MEEKRQVESRKFIFLNILDEHIETYLDCTDNRDQFLLFINILNPTVEGNITVLGKYSHGKSIQSPSKP